MNAENGLHSSITSGNGSSASAMISASEANNQGTPIPTTTDPSQALTLPLEAPPPPPPASAAASGIDVNAILANSSALLYGRQHGAFVSGGSTDPTVASQFLVDPYRQVCEAAAAAREAHATAAQAEKRLFKQITTTSTAQSKQNNDSGGDQIGSLVPAAFPEAKRSTDIISTPSPTAPQVVSNPANCSLSQVTETSPQMDLMDIKNKILLHQQSAQQQQQQQQQQLSQEQHFPQSMVMSPQTPSLLLQQHQQPSAIYGNIAPILGSNQFTFGNNQLDASSSTTTPHLASSLLPGNYVSYNTAAAAAAIGGIGGLGLSSTGSTAAATPVAPNGATGVTATIDPAHLSVLARVSSGAAATPSTGQTITTPPSHTNTLSLPGIPPSIAALIAANAASTTPASSMSSMPLMMLSTPGGGSSLMQQHIESITKGVDHQNAAVSMLGMTTGATVRPQKKKKEKGRPKRPLSAYNLFFQAQRAKILASIPDKGKKQSNKDGESTPASSSVTKRGEVDSHNTDDEDDNAGKEDSDVDTTDQDTKNSNVPVSDGNDSENNKIKNTDKKSGKKTPHRKIGFENLAKIIGRRWKEATEEEIEEYKLAADADLQRYKDEMEIFLTKRQEEEERERKMEETRLSSDDSNQGKKRALSSVNEVSSLMNPRENLAISNKLIRVQHENQNNNNNNNSIGLAIAPNTTSSSSYLHRIRQQQQQLQGPAQLLQMSSSSQENLTQEEESSILSGLASGGVATSSNLGINLGPANKDRWL